MLVKPMQLVHALLKKQAVRFFLVCLLGVIVDVGIGTSVVAACNSSTYVGSISGFSFGLVVAYIGHQKYTFGTWNSPLELPRFITFVCSSFFVICIRFIVIFVGEQFFIINSASLKFLLLIAAITFSFLTNFSISKLIFIKNNA